MEHPENPERGAARNWEPKEEDAGANTGGDRSCTTEDSEKPASPALLGVHSAQSPFLARGEELKGK